MTWRLKNPTSSKSDIARRAEKRKQMLERRSEFLAEKRAREIAVDRQRRTEKRKKDKELYAYVNRDKIAKQNREYRDANRLRTALNSGRRRALELGLPSDVLTTEQVRSYWTDELHINPDLCTYCGSRGYHHLDHAVPLKRGGGHVLTNLLPSCAKCNVLKRTMTAHEFRQAVNAEANIEYNAQLVVQAAHWKAQAERYEQMIAELIGGITDADVKAQVDELVAKYSAAAKLLPKVA